ncbi:MAG: hypothetical protein AAF985_06395 [Bacteroidota bacterium]
MKEEEKEFDQYIQGLFEKDPKVPSDLKWEEMNFTLPDHRDEDKQPGKRYLALLLLLLCLSLIGFFALQPESSIPNINPTNNKVQAIQQNKGKIVDKEVDKETTKQAANSSKATTKESVAKALWPKEAPSPKTTLAKQEKTNRDQSGQQRYADHGSTPPETTAEEDPKIDLPPQPVSSTSPWVSKTPTDEAKSSIKGSTSSLQENTPSQQAPIASSTKEDLTKVKQGLAVGPLISMTFDQASLNPKEHNKELINPAPSPAKSKLQSIYLGFGYHRFGLDIEASNLLRDKVKATLGTSFQAGVRLSLFQQWMGNIGIQLDRYHTTFEHTHDLETQIDFQRNVKIIRKELTFHNNYSHSLGLVLGIDRLWSIHHFVGLRKGLNIRPSYTIAVSGKTTTGAQVRLLEQDGGSNQFALNGGADLGLVFPIGRFLDLELSYQYKRFFYNPTFINREVFSKQVNSLSVVLAYRFVR